MNTRKNYSPEFKAKVALDAISGEKTLSQLSSEYGVNQSLIHKWISQLKEDAKLIYSKDIKKDYKEKDKKIKSLETKVGQLLMERDFLAEAWRKS